MPRQGNLEAFGLNARRVGLYFFLSVTAAVFEGFGIAMFLPVLEFLEKGRDLAVLQASSRMWRVLAEAAGRLDVQVTLVSLLVALVAMMSVRIIATYVRTAYAAWLTQEVLHTTRMSLFLAHIRADYAFFDTLSTGHLVNLLTTETGRGGSYFNGWFNLLSSGTVILGYIGVLFSLSVPMTFMALGLLAVGGVLTSYFAIRKTKVVSRLTTESNKEFTLRLVELLQAVRLVKLCVAVDRESGRVRETSSRLQGHNFRLKILNARINLVLEPLVVAVGAAIIYAAFEIFHAGLAQVGVFMLILMRLMPMATQLLKARQNVLANLGAIEAVRSGLEAAMAAEERQWHGSRTFDGVRRSIEFKGVGFAYPGKEARVFDGLDLAIPAGAMTALVGPSGGGKSTLADLLAGLRRPQEGHILFDGVDGVEFDIASLRGSVAFVSQDAAMFNASVRENLLFTRPGACEDELWAALEKARAAEFVRDLPQGLDSLIGERGVQISGGQRQRLSLARALLEEAPILIMDEPTSALDSETEREIQLAVENMRRTTGLTIVVIAHRLSTVRSADKIAVVMDGRVVEEGAHEELMARGKWYRRLSVLQGDSAALGQTPEGGGDD